MWIPCYRFKLFTITIISPQLAYCSIYLLIRGTCYPSGHPHRRRQVSEMFKKDTGYAAPPTPPRASNPAAKESFHSRALGTGKPILGSGKRDTPRHPSLGYQSDSLLGEIGLGNSLAGRSKESSHTWGHSLGSVCLRGVCFHTMAFLLFCPACSCACTSLVKRHSR